LGQVLLSLRKTKQTVVVIFRLKPCYLVRVRFSSLSRTPAVALLDLFCFYEDVCDVLSQSMSSDS
jgi:hypothetical protein